jgi:hypothetical protein
MGCKFKFHSSVCEDEEVLNSKYCSKHKEVRCYICDGQATHECKELYECHAPLCDNFYCYVTHNKEFNHTISSVYG